MKHNTLLIKMLFLVTILIVTKSSFSKEIVITQNGAISDGITVNTDVIQKSIDIVNENGGGRVVIPSGDFVTGTLFLRDNVELHLERGAVLRGSSEPDHYPAEFIKLREREANALIFAIGQKNIAVTGHGTINGMGDSEIWQLGDNAKGRPKIIYFIECMDVFIDGITLTNAAFWVQDYLACDFLKINNVKVYSYGNHNNDGLDIDSRNVTVSNCIIECDDDALCFKSHISDRPCENITVTNCVLASNCNAIKFGTASKGGFKNITVTNCIIKKPSEDNIRKWHDKIEGIDAGHTVISGLALEMVDGGLMDQINISDIIMDGVQTPIFIKLGDRNRQKDNVPGQMKNIQISNVLARNASLISSSITGFPDNYVSNVSLSNIQIEYKGGGTLRHHSYIVPENEKSYPENRMFGHYLPSYGFFVRHVNNLTLNNVHVALKDADERSVVRLIDVNDSKIIGLKADLPSSKVALFEFDNCRDITVSDFYNSKKHPLFLSLEKSFGIRLFNNDLSGFEKISKDSFNKNILSVD